jgi:hypothetical protein
MATLATHSEARFAPIMEKHLAELTPMDLTLLRSELSITGQPEQYDVDSVTYTLTYTPGFLDSINPSSHKFLKVSFWDDLGTRPPDSDPIRVSTKTPTVITKTKSWSCDHDRLWWIDKDRYRRIVVYSDPSNAAPEGNIGYGSAAVLCKWIG